MSTSLLKASPFTHRVRTTSQRRQATFPLGSRSRLCAQQPHNATADAASSSRVAAARHVCCAAAVEAASTSGREEQEDDARDFAIALARMADDTKAVDITVLHVAPLVSWTSYMVICTVNSRPQLLAVLGRMEDAAVQDWQREKQAPAGSSQWEVLDFGDVVAHVFTQNERDFYQLDDFYATAEEVPLPFAVACSSSSGSTAAPAASASSGEQSFGSSPVWSKNL